MRYNKRRPGQVLLDHLGAAAEMALTPIACAA
jgi:hypothetical protein